MGSNVVAAIVVGAGGALAALVGLLAKLRPERMNLNVEASQRAVSLLKESLDELGDDLNRARATIRLLQASLDQALERARALERELEHERGRVVQLQRRVAELERRQDAATG